MKLHRQILLLPALLFTCYAFSQSNRIDLLNGRFSFIFPDSARSIARGTDIMAADPNANTETRVMYDVGNQRMVFFAEDLQTKTQPQLEVALKKQGTAKYPVAVKQLFQKDSVQLISITPLTFDNTKEAILTQSLMIQNTDGTLSKLSVYLNPQAFKNKASFDAIAAKVFSSFQKGARRLDLQPHTDTFLVSGTKTVLKIPLPKDYVITVDRKYDFEVYKIRKVTTYTDDNYGDLIVYFGFYPSPFSKEYELDKFKTAATDGEFMFQKFKWDNYHDKARTLLLREQLFQDDDIQKGMQIHLALIANNAPAIDELSAIVKKLLLVYDK